MTPTEIEGLVSRARELSTTEDWKEKLSELQAWSSSAVVAGERPFTRKQLGELYSFLCGLIGYLRSGEEMGELLAKAADALSQSHEVASHTEGATIPRTTDEGMREIIVSEWQKEKNCQSDDDLHAISRWKDGTRSLPAVPATVVLAAMRRVSKTDEGRNAVIEECARVCERLGANYDGHEIAAKAIRALTTGGN